MMKTRRLSVLALPLLALAGVLLARMFSTDRETAVRILAVAALGLGMLFALRPSPERAVSGGRRFDQIGDKTAESHVTFSDVAANAEALGSLKELADYLKHPEKYARLGARMPRGVLLYGPPGTGKTLLARALAGEAGVPFFSLSGSDFVQMYVGVGASRVRDLFSKARKAGKCVIFIDEIDALGKKRDASSDEREQTLNALLSEMSGFQETDGVIVLAATNRLDTLDPALTRPGRFDRHIEVGLPGRSERLDILKLHCRNKPVSPAVDLDGLAADTVRFSGASLESLMNEAAIRAARRGGEAIEQTDVDAAYLSVVAGEDKPISASRDELAVVALHEAGHAVASLCLAPENRLARVSILPTGRGAAGYNLSLPPERTLLSKKQLLAQIQILLAGRAAEALLAGDEEEITSGAANDLERAGDLASAMVMDLGMARESAVSLRSLIKGCQASGQDALVQSRELLEEQLKRVSDLLAGHTDELLRLSEALVERESLAAPDLMGLLPSLFPENQAK